jgi:serine protease Do
MTTLGLTGEPASVRGHFVIRVASVEPGGLSQRAGIEPGDIIAGVNDKALEGIDQLEQLSRQGGPLNLVVLDVNSGKAVRVPIELAGVDRSKPTEGLPPLSTQPGENQVRPPADRTKTPPASGRSVGISAEPVQIGQRTGMKVVGVTPGSPAQLAGIEPDDVIVAANGVPITGADALSSVLRKSVGSVTLTIRDTRKGRDVPVEVKFAGQDSAKPAPIPDEAQIPAGAGRKLGAVTELVFNDIDPAAKVTEVQPGSPAAVAGISPGDMIVEANGTPVLHPKTLDEVVRNSGPVLKLTVVNPRTRQKSVLEVRLGAER